MWLLSADRAELHFFPSPENVSDGYAALSHVWDKEEQSFQDVRKIQENCAKDGTNPRDFVSEKIRRCCALAEKHGHKWVWIDICCIDKTSSAELSEAINSMFRYYALARICYGYLPDVSSVEFSLEDVEKDRNSRKGYRHSRYRSFGRSIWFTRGWTLQELIAPRFFVFLSSSWKIIGTKADLAELMEWWCDIPAAVLRFQVKFTEFSIAQRMSWFGLRETTRPEDEAYCLLGLFDIHMPPLYGEGRNAFRRLQEEILKQSADTTLFAWSGHSRCLFAASPSDFVRDAGIEVVYTPPPPTQVLADTVHEAGCWTFCLPCSYLVALVCGTIAPVTLRGVSPPEIRGGAMNDMTFAITPTGIRACIPIFTWRGEVFGDLHWSSPQGGRVFLRLELDPDSQASSSRRPSYRVGRPRLARSYLGGAYRTVRPPDALPAHSAASRFTPAIPMQLTFDAPVRFPEARIQQFLDDSGFTHFETRGAGLHSPWTANSDLPTEYVFTVRSVKWGYRPFFTIISVGQCQHEGQPQEQRRRSTALWATVKAGDDKSAAMSENEISKLSADPLHDCSRDHVLRWPALRKGFELHVRDACLPVVVTLSFTPCPLNPERTLVLDASYHRV